MRVLIILAIVLLSSFKIEAQVFKELESSTPKERATLFSKQVANHLMLTEQQYKSIAEINLAYALKIAPIAEGKGNKLGKLTKIKSLDKQRDKEIANILTPAQLDSYLSQKKVFVKNVRMMLKLASTK